MRCMLQATGRPVAVFPNPPFAPINWIFGTLTANKNIRTRFLPRVACRSRVDSSATRVRVERVTDKENLVIDF